MGKSERKISLSMIPQHNYEGAYMCSVYHIESIFFEVIIYEMNN